MFSLLVNTYSQLKNYKMILFLSLFLLSQIAFRYIFS